MVISSLTRRKPKLHLILDIQVEKIAQRQEARILPFPDTPLDNSNNTFIVPVDLDQPEIDVLNKITIDLLESQQIEKLTAQQSLEPEWMAQRSMKLTASNFGKVVKRKRPPTEPILRDIFVPKDFSKVSSIRHGW